MKKYLFIILFILINLQVPAKADQVQVDSANIEEAVRLVNKGSFREGDVKLSQIPLEESDVRLKNRIDFLKGYIAYKEKRYEDALSIFNTLLKSYPMIGEYILYYTALVYEESGQIPAAIDIFEDIKKRFKASPVRVESDIHLIEGYLSTGNYKSGISAIKDFLDSYSDADDIPFLKFLIGVSYEINEETAKAYQEYKDIYIRYPLYKYAKEAEERMNLTGDLLKDKDKGFKGIAMEERMERIDSLIAEKDFKTAVRELKIFIDNRSWSEALLIDALYKLGTSYISMREDMKGIDVLEEVIRRYPEYKATPKIHYILAKRYWNKGDTDKAIEHCGIILDKFSKTKWAEDGLYVLGKIFEEFKAFPAAEAYYLEIIKRFPKGDNAAEVSWRIGWLYFREEKYEEAVSAFETMINRYPMSDYIYSAIYWKGRGYEKLGNKDEAIAAFSRLEKAYPYSYYGNMAKLRGEYLKDLIEKDAIDEKMYKLTNIQNRDIIKNLYPSAQNAEIKPALNKLSELIILGLYKEARGEAAVVSKKGLTDNLDDALSLGMLYIKADDYRSCLNLLNLLTIKRDIKTLPLDFWKMYYPLAYFEDISVNAEANNLDPFFVLGVIRQESGFNSRVLSKTGAVGLMQLMPDTANKEAAKLNLNIKIDRDALITPSVNVTIGTAHLKRLIERFDGNIPLILIGYNAGPHKSVEWSERFAGLERDIFIESIPYAETRGFVKNVFRNYLNYRNLYE